MRQLSCMVWLVDGGAWEITIKKTITAVSAVQHKQLEVISVSVTGEIA